MIGKGKGKTKAVSLPGTAVPGPTQSAIKKQIEEEKKKN